MLGVMLQASMNSPSDADDLGNPGRTAPAPRENRCHTSSRSTPIGERASASKLHINSTPKHLTQHWRRFSSDRLCLSLAPSKRNPDHQCPRWLCPRSASSSGWSRDRLRCADIAFCFHTGLGLRWEQISLETADCDWVNPLQSTLTSFGREACQFKRHFDPSKSKTRPVDPFVNPLLST